MSREFDGRVAYVTGAAEVQEHGVKALAVRLDVADGAAVREAVGATVRAFGRLDFAHNNAGTFAVAPLADLAASIWSGRYGEAPEVAEAVVRLCSSVAAYVNGVVLPDDGGYLAA